MKRHGATRIAAGLAKAALSIWALAVGPQSATAQYIDPQSVRSTITCGTSIEGGRNARSCSRTGHRTEQLVAREYMAAQTFPSQGAANRLVVTQSMSSSAKLPNPDFIQGLFPPDDRHDFWHTGQIAVSFAVKHDGDPKPYTVDIANLVAGTMRLDANPSCTANLVLETAMTWSVGDGTPGQDDLERYERNGPVGYWADTRYFARALIGSRASWHEYRIRDDGQKYSLVRERPHDVDFWTVTLTTTNRMSVDGTIGEDCVASIWMDEENGQNHLTTTFKVSPASVWDPGAPFTRQDGICRNAGNGWPRWSQRLNISKQACAEGCSNNPNCQGFGYDATRAVCQSFGSDGSIAGAADASPITRGVDLNANRLFYCYLKTG